MSVTASMVKELRERTGAGMMECKKALVASNGNIEAAIENMRKSGQAKAAKKAGRIAAEGVIVIRVSDDAKDAVMLEINCETDFVSRDDSFIEFTNHVADIALADKPGSIESLSALTYPEATQTVEETRQALVAKIGENIHMRRLVEMASSGLIASYIHGGRIGVLVALEGGDEALGRDIAMHIAAAKPEVIAPEDVSKDRLDKEREIFTAQAQESGKPPEIVEKMVGGRLKKFLGEISLLGQSYVKDPDQTVEKVLKVGKAKVVAFERFEVGEGIEKKAENFADEVMAQVRGE